jgi:fatty acid amide hydrolase
LIKDQFVNEIRKKWKKQGLTAVISPVYPTCAITKEAADDLGGLMDYTMIWSLLGFPCGVLPVTKVNAYEQTFKDHHNDAWTQAQNKSAHKSEGMPIGLQIVGFTNEDEKVLGLMKVLESKVNYKQEVPQPIKDIF